MKKKLLALTLATAMMLSACGTNTTQPAETTTTTEQNNTAGNTDDTQPEDTAERPKVSVMLMNIQGELKAEGSDEVIQMVKDYTETDVEFNFVPNDSYDDKLGVTLMDKSNMPTIIVVPRMNATILQAANAGAFWDLSEFLEDSATFPNLSQANENVLESITVNGQVIGVYRQRPLGRNGLGYRKDWAEKLGLGEPETVEDIYNMAKAFVTQDPDGNGIDDTYAFEWCKWHSPLDIIQTWFGAGNTWTEQDGKLIPVHQTEEYMEALKWMKKIYDEGFVYQDFAVRDTAGWSDAVKNGECGMFLDVLDNSKRIWEYFDTNEIPSVMGDGNASMAYVGAVKADANSEPKTLATSGMNGFIVITKAAAPTKEDAIAALKFLDKMCDDKMLELADFGIEGKTYDLDADGNVEVHQEPPIEQRSITGLNQIVPYIPNRASTDLGLAKNIPTVEFEKVQEENEAYVVYNPAAGFMVNSETYSINGANLDQILIDARTQYICGQIDEAGLEAAFRNWDTQGGTKMIEEINTIAGN